MTSRERVLHSLARKGYDRIPVKHEGTPEVNRMLMEHFGLSNREQLLRVPGIGPLGAASVIKARSLHKITDLGMLRQIGVHAARAADFLLLNGKRPALQLPLF